MIGTLPPRYSRRRAYWGKWLEYDQAWPQCCIYLHWLTINQERRR